jgi:hypothetical protein
MIEHELVYTLLGESFKQRVHLVPRRLGTRNICPTAIPMQKPHLVDRLASALVKELYSHRTGEQS